MICTIVALVLSWQGQTSRDLILRGLFSDAEDTARQEIAADSHNAQSHWRLGLVLLYRNKLDQAVAEFNTARRIDPGLPLYDALLAEAAYRSDDFKSAADLFEKAGRTGKAAQLRSFAGRKPYEMSGAGTTVVKFVQTDPMPMIEVQVNGGPAVNFLIDTGAAEVTLDRDYAKSIGVTDFGDEDGTFGGGKKAKTGLGAIESLSLGGLTVKNLPVLLLNTQAFSVAAQGKPVSGVVGTVFLYHFLSTLDYPGGRLVLAPRTQHVSDGGVSIRFWMAGDHFMVANGRLDDAPGHLFLIDTGLAGAAFTGPESTLEEAGIQASLNGATEGVGGGGAVMANPFPVSKLSLGAATGTSLTGIYGVFPPSFEQGLGFHLGGLISHQFFRPYAVTFDFQMMRIVLK